MYTYVFKNLEICFVVRHYNLPRRLINHVYSNNLVETATPLSTTLQRKTDRTKPVC